MSDETRAIPLAAPAWRPAWEEYVRSVEVLTMLGETVWQRAEAAFAAGWQAREERVEELSRELAEQARRSIEILGGLEDLRRAMEEHEERDRATARVLDGARKYASRVTRDVFTPSRAADLQSEANVLIDRIDELLYGDPATAARTGGEGELDNALTESG